MTEINKHLIYFEYNESLSNVEQWLKQKFNAIGFDDKDITLLTYGYTGTYWEIKCNDEGLTMLILLGGEHCGKGPA